MFHRSISLSTTPVVGPTIYGFRKGPWAKRTAGQAR